jgi:hypothetical protein
MLARRLLLLTAVLMLLTVLAAGLAPNPAPVDEVRSSPAPAQPVEAVQGRLSASDDDQSVTARVGDLVEIEVSGDVLDIVEIERLERLDPIEPTTPARFQIIPDEPGVYPIRLVEADRRIGRLDVRP